MKILLAHAFSKKNLGDAAICTAMIYEFKRVFPNAQLSISIMDKVGEPEFIDVEQFQSFFYYAVYTNKNPFVQIFKTLYMVSSTIIWSFVFRLSGLRSDFLLTKSLKILLYHFVTADLIVPVGGGYLNGKKGLRNSIALVLSLHEILIPIILKKKVVLYSQSIGPFGNKFQLHITSFVLNKVDAIFVRENISKNLLINKMKIMHPEIIQTTDAGFLFSSNEAEKMKLELENIGVDLNKLRIGITVRNWLSKTNQNKFENSIVEFIEKVSEKYNASIILIAQVITSTHNEDDREVNKRIYSKLKNKKNVFLLNKEYSHFEVKGIYENLDYLIGTRMHSIIFSLTGRIPCLAIEYEYKTRGIMNDLGLGNWVIKMEDITFSNLLSKFDELVDNKDTYLSTLDKGLESYIPEAKNTALELKRIYEK